MRRAITVLVALAGLASSGCAAWKPQDWFKKSPPQSSAKPQPSGTKVAAKPTDAAAKRAKGDSIPNASEVGL